MRPLCRPRIRFPRAVKTSYRPAQLASLYRFPTGVPGPDQTIGVVSLGGGYDPADVRAAFAAWALPAPHLTDVSVQGGRNSPGDDADVENLLDVQVAAAAYSYCTGRPATVRIYFAPNTDAGFRAAVTAAMMDGCAVVSISWGAPEKSWGESACRAFDEVCARALARGTVVFAASGDNLSDDGDGDGKPDADFPAASPHVIGVGGTTRTAAGDVVWNEGGGGTGGGYSRYFQPQAWQAGVPAGPGRMVPDLAADADPATGYQIRVRGSWTVVGGTSASTPLVAGLVAAIAAAAAGAGRVRLGDLLPFLYKHPAAFVDVTEGTNGQFRAGVGPDPCTGLGVPVGTALLDAVLAAVTTPPAPPPNQPPSPPPPTKPPEPVPVTQILTGSVDVPILGKCKMTGVITPAPAGSVANDSMSADPALTGKGLKEYGWQVLALAWKYGKIALPVILAGVEAGKSFREIEADVLTAVLAAGFGMAA